jgi:hypothetical protein
MYPFSELSGPHIQHAYEAIIASQTGIAGEFLGEERGQVSTVDFSLFSQLTRPPPAYSRNSLPQKSLFAPLAMTAHRLE